MKYLFINSVYGIRSTGKIIASKCHELMADGHECLAAYGRANIDDDVPKVQIGTRIDYYKHAAESRIFDNQGLASKRATKEFIKKASEFKPDVVWLHNIHGYYINYELLFDWLKKNPSIEVKWTLHDCWAFTGHCSHFTIARCNKWQTQCFECPQKKEYPTSLLVDASKRNFNSKKAAFTGLEKMRIITPSEWLAGLVKESFLSEYPVEVVNNTIDLDIFKPTPGSFRERYGLTGKHIVLGVAVGWESTKGLPDMFELRNILDESYAIVLVGMTSDQLKTLPKGILGIERTQNQQQLAEIYTAADVFVNPTHQDNYPTVNLEARACGTPVVTYDVGGSPESAGHEHIVQEGNIQALAEEIKSILRERYNE